MKFSNNIDPFRCLSRKLGNRKRPLRVTSRPSDGLPRNKKLFSNLKERFELQRDRQLNIEIDDPQFITFPKYGIRRDGNERFLPRSVGKIRVFNKRLKCSVLFPANRRYTLMVNFLKNLNQWRLKDKIPEERNYVKHNKNLNGSIKAAFGVVPVHTHGRNPVLNNYHSSRSLPKTSFCQYVQSNTPNSSCSSINQANSIISTSIGNQTETEIWDGNTDS